MAEEDLYDGFATGGAESAAAAAGLSSFGTTRATPGTAMNPIRGLKTGAGASGDGPRPMTSVKGAGYSNRTPGTAVGRSSAVFNAAAAGGAATGSSLPSYSDAPEVSPEDTAKEMEAKVHSLLEASAEAAAKGDAVQTLERAKECVRREKALVKFKDTNGLSDSINLDLTFSVNLNLAQAYHINKMHTEALNTYTGLVKNKQFVQGSRLRINMGNIYSEEKKYSQAIKQYRMAVDQIPASNKNLKCKVQRNIGNCLVKCGQFQDAITAFEMVMEAEPEFPAGFNLIVCYYALGDIELMKKGFQRLLAVPLPMEEEDQEEEEEGKKGGAASAGGREGGSGSGSSSSVAEDVLEDLHALEISRDALSEALRSRQRNALELVGNAAKLIAPVIEPRDWVQGYDWVIEQLKSRHSTVCSELQICKALEYMAHRQFDRAIEDLKAFEKKDVHLRARAANNLSFLYFLEGDVAQAHKYANLAVKHDRYNAKALVNLGNCLLEQGDMDRAKELYLEAIGVEADCVEAIYNLGLVNRQLQVLHEALQAFEKLHTLVPSAPEVIYQIATLYETMGNYKAAIKYFNLLISKVPTDPGILAHLGQIYAKEEDDAQAFHYHQESYRFYPVSLDVISWLGIWYVKSELYEKAIEFFERASEIQPQEAKWKLMVASCHRRMANYVKALELYQSIHEQHPENLECLRYLVALCKDLNRPFEAFETALLRLERLHLQQQQAAQAAAYARGEAASDEYAAYEERAAAASAAASSAYGGYGGGRGHHHGMDGEDEDDDDLAGEEEETSAESSDGGAMMSAAMAAAAAAAASRAGGAAAGGAGAVAGSSRGGSAAFQSVSSAGPVAAMDDSRKAGIAAAAAVAGTDPERFAAPTMAGYDRGSKRGVSKAKEEDFADADLSSLLTE